METGEVLPYRSHAHPLQPVMFTSCGNGHLHGRFCLCSTVIPRAHPAIVARECKRIEEGATRTTTVIFGRSNVGRPNLSQAKIGISKRGIDVQASASSIHCPFTPG